MQVSSAREVRSENTCVEGMVGGLCCKAAKKGVMLQGCYRVVDVLSLIPISEPRGPY